MNSNGEHTTLYLSFDGLLQPLGASQVHQLVLGLAGRGVPYEVLTLERAADLADHERVSATERDLAAVGVRWDRSQYQDEGGAGAALMNLRNAFMLTHTRARHRNAQLIHARGYHAAVIARVMNARAGIPYIFDARGYWIDERLAEGRWFTNRPALAAARALERDLYANAAAVVTLTDLHAADLRADGWRTPTARGPVVTIPTCADYKRFPLRRAIKPHSGLVLGLIGSINPSYHMTDAVRLCRLIMDRRHDATLLAVSSQQAAFRQLLTEGQIDRDRCQIISAPHEQMPAILERIDWGVMLLSESHAKRASMPTKLAEFFASGVRPVHYGCNSEVADWIQRAGSGYSLPSLAPAELERAAAFVATSEFDDRLLHDARLRTAPHFDLANGIQRYLELLESVSPPSG